MASEPVVGHATSPGQLGWGKREGWLGGVAAAIALLVVVGWTGTLVAPGAIWALPTVLLLAAGAALVARRSGRRAEADVNSPWTGFAFAFGVTASVLGLTVLAAILFALLFGVSG